MEVKEGIVLDRDGTPLTGSDERASGRIRVWRVGGFMAPLLGVLLPVLAITGFAVLAGVILVVLAVVAVAWSLGKLLDALNPVRSRR